MTLKAGSTFTAGPAVVSMYGSFRTLVRSRDEHTGRKIAITWVGVTNPKRGPEESRDAYHERCRATELERARQNEANATFIAEAFTVAHETGLTPRQLAKQRDELLSALKQALRYIEVSVAYQGAMTADQVEAKIKANANIGQTGIAANSCHTLATFNFEKARAAIAKATAGGAV